MKGFFICFFLFTIVMINQNISIYAQISPESSDKVPSENDTQISPGSSEKIPREEDYSQISYEDLAKLGGEYNPPNLNDNTAKVSRKIQETSGQTERKGANKYSRGCSHLTRCRD
ncbi:hypothetical protein RYX36_024884 [Vicia faba]